jgi:type IV secretion system protein VirD4
MSSMASTPGTRATWRELALPLAAGAVVGFAVVVLPAAAALAGAGSGVLSGRGWTLAGYRQWPGIMLRLPQHADDPAAAFPPAAAGRVGPTWLFWSLAVLLVVVAVVGLGWVALWATRPWRRRPGYASPADLRRVATAAAVLRAAPQVRPDLAGERATVRQVASFLGTEWDTKTRLYRSYNSNCVVVGPSQMGKSAMVVGQIVDADGPAVVTSTRADLLWRTAAARQRRRPGAPLLVWDPEGRSGWPAAMQWSPVAGCEEPSRAQQRAAALVAGARVGEDVTDGGTWQEIAAEILAYYLHAAALTGRSLRDVLDWSANPADETPQEALRGSQVGTSFWAARLAGYANDDPRLVSNMWFGVRLALKATTNPRVLDACCPPAGEGLDSRTFLVEGGSLYLLGSAAQQATVAPLVTALVEDLVESARQMAMASTYERLTPPLHLFLDEVANIAPLPSLPSLMSDGAGVGISVTAVAQSPAQLQERWGEKAAQAMWDNATTKVLYGGSAYPDVLEDISRLCGEFDQSYEVRTSGGVFYPGQASTSVQQRKERVVPVDHLYTLQPLTALLLARATRPVKLRIEPWWQRPDAAQLRADEAALKAGRVLPTGSGR